MKRLGPDLKLSKLRGGDLKVPAFLSDLYYDLRDRRLLPIVALVLVAIVAAPFLLRGDSDELEPLPAPNPIATTPAEGSSLDVVQAQPGLRNYKKRLARRKPTDPFHQRFTGPVLKGQEQRAQVAVTSTTSSESAGATPESGSAVPPISTPAEPTPGGSSPGGGSPSDGGNSASGGLVYYAFEVDVEITRIETGKDGKVQKTGPATHKNVLPPTPLPGAKAPVVTYIGISPKTHQPLFVVSPDVISTFGEGKCVSGTDTCQMMEIEPGFTETFTYGEGGVRYKINVGKPEPVVTGHS
jgi:hypothetical protein